MSSHSRHVTASVALIVAAASFTLTACTGAVYEPAAATTPEAAVTSTPTASATPDPHRLELEREWPDTDVPLQDRCDLNQGDKLADDAIINDTLQLRPFEHMRDLGTMDGASGEVALNDDGSLASYVVAPGDTAYAIQQRFCMDGIMFEALNAVRRAPGWLSGGDFPATALYAGDTLNLDPHTITSVGDENGEVYENTPTFAIPEQR